MDIGKRIREIRLERGLTLEKVAFDADMDASNLSRIERGSQQPSSALLKRIATALHTPVSLLYGESDEGFTRQAVGAGKDSQKMLRQFQQLDTHHRKLALALVKLLTKAQSEASSQKP